MYSLGVIFYMLAFGKSPFESKSQKDLEMRNEASDINYAIVEKQTKISESGINLLRQLLEKNPASRISAFNALGHQWFINTHVKVSWGHLNIPKGVKPTGNTVSYPVL
jgi:serine/threonine protein kinase